MELLDLSQLLKNNRYPGRGIVLGLTPDGRKAAIAYWIMGRSANSRNRVFTPKDGGIITEAADPAKLEDPSLIIYAPVRVQDGVTVVTNGDQTDTVCEFLARGESFAAALRTREFEPDAPNYTPRISGIVLRRDGKLSYKLSILKSDNAGAACVRFFYEYDAPAAGEGRFVSTYACDGSPIPSFEGEPRRVAILNDPDRFGEMLWDSLDAENKVSLFVRYIDLASGGTEDRIYNKYQKV